MAGLVIVVGVVLSGCVALVVGLARAPVAAANEFVAHLDDGEMAEAYNSLCTDLRSELTLDEFQAHYRSAPDITGYLLTSTSSAIGELTTVSGTIDIGGEPQNVMFQMVREHDEWRVCHYDLLE